MFNTITLIGNIGQEVKYVPMKSGGEMAVMNMATHRYTGGSEKVTDWHKVVIFDPKKTEIVKRFVKVGSRLLVKGSLTYEEWNDQHGQKRKTAQIEVGYRGEILMMDSKAESEALSTPTTNNQSVDIPSGF